MQAKLEFTEFFIVSMSLPEDFLKQLKQYRELSNREKEVFIEIFGRGKSRVEVAQTLNICDSNLSSCLTGIYKKFQITGSGPVKEPRLREYLEKRYSQQKFPVNADDNIADDRIDALVQEIRALIKPTIKEKCGTMRVLDMAQPIELTGERGIYTNVNILEKLNRSRRRGIPELSQNCNPEDFNRFGLSKVTEKRVPGLEAVQRHSKLMVLGKPGAGKTTFLKYLAMHCIEGDFLTNQVPFFITLKEFAEKPKQPDLLEYMAQQLLPYNVKDAKDKIDKLLIRGRGLILLDGLDEVREEDTKRILNQILEISDQFYTNQFLITCRIAAKEYTFERFTEVEMADFDKRQIKTFSQNWFRLSDAVKADSFIKRLEESEPIYELGTNPLLLTLLCLVFGENNDFPANRSELYKEGVDILLKKWDARTEPEELEIDSEAVLKSMESQHGLLVERARGIYSFSHLTFHEYFTAREIVGTNGLVSLKKLVKHINDKRWRDVFLLTVGMMRQADSLFLLMKDKIDNIVANDVCIQNFMEWVYEKSSEVKVPYKPEAVRAFYFALNYNFDNLYNHAALSVFPIPKLTHKLDNRFVFSHELRIDVGLSNTLIKALEPTQIWDEICERWIPNFDYDGDFYSELESVIQCELDPEIKELLLSLKYELPAIFRASDMKYNKIVYNQIIDVDINSFDRSFWAINLQEIMIEHRNIGYDWELNYSQKELLQQYYNANTLLIECLNSDCYVSREIRQEIEDTLLLPTSEIEKRKKK